MEVVIIATDNSCLNNRMFAESAQRIVLKRNGNFLKFVDNPSNRHYVEVDAETGDVVRMILKSKVSTNRLHCGINKQCRLEADEVCFFGIYSNITGKHRGKGITFRQILENDTEQIKWMVGNGYTFEPSFREQITDKLHSAV